MSRRTLRKFARFIDRRLAGVRRRWDEWTLPEFANEPRHLTLPSPRIVLNAHLIQIGSGCHLGRNATLAAVTSYADGGDQTFRPKITIGDRVWATQNLQLFCADQIEIGDDVLIANNVFIYDHEHGKSRADIPYRRQPLERVLPVRIGRGSWIGQNAIILPGVTIGEFSIIGANSVVTRSVPQRSIAVGSPAKVIRVWNTERNGWDNANP